MGTDCLSQLLGQPPQGGRLRDALFEPEISLQMEEQQQIFGKSLPPASSSPVNGHLGYWGPYVELQPCRVKEGMMIRFEKAFPRHRRGDRSDRQRNGAKQNFPSSGSRPEADPGASTEEGGGNQAEEGRPGHAGSGPLAEKRGQMGCRGGTEEMAGDSFMNGFVLDTSVKPAALGLGDLVDYRDLLPLCRRYPKLT